MVWFDKFKICRKVKRQFGEETEERGVGDQKWDKDVERLDRWIKEKSRENVLME